MWFFRKAEPVDGDAAERAARAELDKKVEQVHREAGKGYVAAGPRSRSARIASRRTVTRGPGMEFLQAKDFIAGEDDPRSIMGRKSLASGNDDQIICKVTRPETQVHVFLLADTSKTLDFGHSRESKLHLMARCGVTVCYSLKDTQDFVKPILYANNEVVWTTPRAMAPLMVSRKLAIEILDPVYSTGELKSGLVQALDKVPKRGQSEIVLMSDFLNMTPEETNLLRITARRNSVRALVIQDERERYLPEPPFGLPFPLRVFDLSTGQQYTWWNTRSNRDLYTREFEEHEARLKAFFKDCGITYQFVSTNEGKEATRKVLQLLSLPPLHR